MTCLSCHRANPAGATWCGHCGSALGSSVACAACGHANPEGLRFCTRCGRGIAEPVESRNGPESFAGGRYRVERLLGEGSRKRVYLVHDTRLDRRVAFALVRTEGLDRGGRARIRREARVTGRLGDHPNVVTVYDTGEDDGRPYIVTQYMPGGSLADLLARAEHRCLPLAATVDIGVQLCRALDAAHRAGVVHRDVKPSNVWLTIDGTALLGDFGLAFAADHSRLSVEGTMVGSAAYMPPEQALGRGADARSDLYSLGALLYELVCGTPPFTGDDAVSVISKHLHVAPVPLLQHAPDIPPGLDTLVTSLLAKDPDRRPATALDVAAALERLAIDPPFDPAGSSGARTGEIGEPTAAAPVAGSASEARAIWVGRERELASLEAGLAQAMNGRGQLFLLAGEPGIGKTTTAEALGARAVDLGAQVVVGRCYDGEGAPTFWPWIQVVRECVRDRDPAALSAAVGSGAADLVRLVPELRERVAGLRSLDSPTVAEPEQARFRLFDAVTGFLHRAAASRPLVIVLDDLHWADTPSLLLLQFIARELDDDRILLVGTYRDHELGRDHPLSRALGELVRANATSRIALGGITADDVARYVEQTTGAAPSPELVAALHRQTGGNPFFVSEIVRLLAADLDPGQALDATSVSLAIPQSVREVVGRRLDRLSEDCNLLLAVAAVAGRDVGLELLERVSGLAEDRLLDALDEAVAARVLTEAPGVTGRFRCTHDLVRESVYGELRSAQRVRLHRKVAEALEDAYAADPDPHVGEVAHHWFHAAAAGNAEKALDHLTRAGRRAVRLLAHEEAAEHFQRALEVLDLVEHPDPARRGELLLDLGAATLRSGDTPAARTALLRAARSARTSGATELLARAALALTDLVTDTVAGEVDEELIGLLEESLAALPPDDRGLRARLLARLAVALYWSDQADRRAALIDEATAIAEALQEPVALADVLNCRRIARWSPDNQEERLADAARVLQLARQLAGRPQRPGDPAPDELAMSAHHWRIIDLLEQGDVSGANQAIEAHARLAEASRQPLARMFQRMIRSARATMDGRYAESETAAREAIDIAERMRLPNTRTMFTSLMLAVWVDQGREDEAATASLPRHTSALHRTGERAIIALAHVIAGRVDEARAEFDRLAGHDFADLPRDGAWLWFMSVLTRVCSRLGDQARARTLYTLLLPLADRHVVIGPPLLAYRGPVSYHLGVLASTVGDTEAAAAHLERAIATADAARAHPFVAQARYAYARVLLERGDVGAAMRELNVVLATAGELGMTRLLERATKRKLVAQQALGAGVTTSIDAVAWAVGEEQPELDRYAAPDGDLTILFSDVERFAELTEQLGDSGIQAVIRSHNTIVRAEIADHRGIEIKSVGDGFMVVFADASDGVRCAVAIQRAFAVYDAEHADCPVHVRIGIHAGAVIREAHDVHGRNVIVAARIAGEARGGEILVSDEVMSRVGRGGDIGFDEGRDVVLKGLAASHRVHRVLAAGLPEPSANEPEPVVGGAAVVAMAQPAHGVHDATSLFRREGEYWTIAYDGDVFRLRDARGLRFIARLLSEPGREIHALDLEAGTDGGPTTTADPRLAAEAGLRADAGASVGAALDARAKAEYKRRLEELTEDLEEARSFNDPERAARAEAEIDFLVHELSAAVGLGGRDRPSASAAERARVNVTRSVKTSLRKIGAHSPALGRHLGVSIRTGTFCCYRPDPRVQLHWEVGSDDARV